MCEVSKVECIDCGSVASYSFVIVVYDGKTTAFMQLASCKRCREHGDHRSLRNFVRADKESILFAMSHKLPMLIIGG